MAGIKQPIQDLLTLLKSMDVTNGDGNTVKLYTRLWNNQLQRMREQQIEAFPLPAAFVEFVSYTEFENVGVKVIAGKVKFKIHILHEFLDAQDGTMGQDLVIFDLKDQINRRLYDAVLTGCSTLVRIGESSANDFDNVHEYVLEYQVHFMDSVNSPYDSGNGKYIQTTPPTQLQLTVTKVTSL